MNPDEIIYGLTGEYAWIRRQVWFWQRKAMEDNGWKADPSTGWLRPVMVFKHRRPNGFDPSILWLNKESAA